MSIAMKCHEPWRQRWQWRQWGRASGSRAALVPRRRPRPWPLTLRFALSFGEREGKASEHSGSSNTRHVKESSPVDGTRAAAAFTGFHCPQGRTSSGHWSKRRPSQPRSL